MKHFAFGFARFKSHASSLFFAGILEDLEQERLIREEEEAERKSKAVVAKRAKIRK